MSGYTMVMGLTGSPNERFKGKGQLGGSPLPIPNPDGLDGRARILNVPSRIRIKVFERRSMVCVGATMSALDGTWSVGRLDTARRYVIIGFDGAGMVNADIQDWIQPAIGG